MSEYPGTRYDLTCPDCGAAMSLVPNRYKPGAMHYACENGCCTHGAHPDGRPLGVPADKATRLARMEAHRQFDRLWRYADSPMTRKKAYLWLKRQTNMTRVEAHIGRFTIEQCEQLVAALMRRHGQAQ